MAERFEHTPSEDDVEKIHFLPSEDGSPPPPELVDRIKSWLRAEPRGRAALAHMLGQGPEPEPLFVAVRDSAGNASLLLGSGDVDVTGIEPSAEILLPTLFEQDPTD